MKRILSLLLAFLLWAPAAFGWSFGVCGDSRDDLHGVLPRILAAVEEFPKPLFLVIGNHELYGATREEFARFFGIPGTSYSFTHKDAHFSIVDNASGGLSDSRLAWLDQDLAAHPKGIKGVRYLVVAMHIPPRTDTIFPHGTARNYETLVEDWEGIKVIVSGGAGAPMFPFQRFGFFRIDLEEGQVREKFLRIREQHGG
jgi:hypothetical protein